MNAPFDFASAGGHHVRAVVHTAGISPQMGTAAKVAHITGTGSVNIAQSFLQRASEGGVLVSVASAAGHSMPKALIPFRAFRLAETDPAKFESIIVSRARTVRSRPCRPHRPRARRLTGRQSPVLAKAKCSSTSPLAWPCIAQAARPLTVIGCS